MPLAGLLLTHGELPKEAMIDFCRPALASGLPVLAVESDSYTTARQLDRMANDIPIDDPERAEQVTRFVADHLDLGWLKETLSRGYPSRLSPPPSAIGWCGWPSRRASASCCPRAASRAPWRPR